VEKGGGIMAAKALRELVKRERTKPLSPFYEIEQWFEEAWKKPFSFLSPTMFPGIRATERYEMTPSVDIFEEGNEVVMKADLPGLTKDDLKIDLSENVLTLSGEKKKEEKIDREDYFRYERSFGSFCRRFELPGDLDTEKIKAHFEDGVLEVRIPMLKPSEKKHRKIPIV
jgi:HSP20 family protein